MTPRLHHRRGVLQLGARPALMAVLNVTPDSFSDGGRFKSAEQAADEALRLLAQGADIIDVGGESTRPGAQAVSAQDELQRVVPVIQRLRAQSEAVISIDTCKAEVARAAVEAGADIVNDVTAGTFDQRMLPLCAELGAGLVLMHTPVAPDQTHREVHYEGITETVRAHLEHRLQSALDAGVPRSHIALDPGFGFGKNAAQNFELAQGLERIAELGPPLLVGISRKRMVREALAALTPPAAAFGERAKSEDAQRTAAQAAERANLDAASAALALVLATKGARIIRAHDVPATRNVIAICAALWAAERRKSTP